MLADSAHDFYHLFSASMNRLCFRQITSLMDKTNLNLLATLNKSIANLLTFARSLLTGYITISCISSDC